MKVYLIIFTLLFTYAATAGAANPAQWDRSSAMAAVESVNVDRAVYELGPVTSLSDGKAMLEKLTHMETRGDWPPPAREAALYEFTRSLATLPRAAVAAEVIQHLQNYQAQTLVPHEDHGNTLVPLFNIRGAAAGIENGWQRTEFALEAATILATDPAGLVSGYAESASHNRRSGYLDALGHADMNAVEAVQNEALERLEYTPELTPVLGRTAVITADTFAAHQLLIHGRGVGLSAALRQLDQRLAPAQTADLLMYAVHQAPAENTQLAIAAWWPRVRHEATVRELLLDRLGDPALGAAAALALAQSPDIQTIKSLQDMASGDSLAARRAQMALDINRDRLVSEVQR